MLHRWHSSDGPQVERWNLFPSEAFKGCAISPDGNLVAYWTDDKISLYTSESLRLQNLHTASPASNYLLETKYNTTRMWKAIALTQRYLVASTTGGDFQVRTPPAIDFLERELIIDEVLHF
jgi:hypothetical protein